jgi:hypothetical protein
MRTNHAEHELTCGYDISIPFLSVYAPNDLSVITWGKGYEHTPC